VEASVAEFIPKTIHARVGQKLTWQVIGDTHSVSFDVPRYSPVFTRAGNGTVAFYNPSWQPAGGPGFPNPFASGPPPPPGGALPPVAVDAGNYNGSHFQSSGVGGPSGGPPQEFSYSVTFTRAGNYKFACLVHPQMVGEVDVS
jgi:plastocyanin